MSRNARVLSKVEEGELEWYLGWVAPETPTAPADSSSALLGYNGSAHFPVGGGKDDIFSVWFGRVRSFELRPTEGPASSGAVPELTITPGPDAYLPAFNLGIEGKVGWSAVGVNSPPTIVTKEPPANKERHLPFDRDDVPTADEANFEFTWATEYSYDAAIPALSVTCAFEFELKILWNAAVNYGGVAYVPYTMKYIWTYVDDVSTAQGGYVTELSLLPTGGRLSSGNLTVQVRVGEREFGGANHFVPFSISATEFVSNGILSGDTETRASTSALEVGGRPQNSHLWLQPIITEQTYFPYQSDNSDPTTACVDKDSGHHLFPDEDMPLTIEDDDD